MSLDHYTELFSSYCTRVCALDQADTPALIALVTITLLVAYAVSKLIGGLSLQGLFSAAKYIPGVQGVIKKEVNKALSSLEKDLKSRGPKTSAIPDTGLSHAEVVERMEAMKKDDFQVDNGKVFGCVYMADKEHQELMNKAYAMFALSNPLHPTVFPAAKKMEAEVLAMCVDMMNGPKGACGSLTSGGTESILMAMKTYRSWGKAKGITKPELVVPISAHAAFDKACEYFGIKKVEVPNGADFRVDVGAMAKLITKNTIAVVGSAPSYPHGMIDDIEAIGKLALRHKINMHVDGCLGGFLTPWLYRIGELKRPCDFSVPGVTSISADLHKYGQATKGTSVVLYRTEELRRFQYFKLTTWPGGLYCSPTVAGSRPGALTACAWASLMSVGKDGYKKMSGDIHATWKTLRDGIAAIEDVQMVGEPDCSVLAWRSDAYDMFKVADVMASKGWHIERLQFPMCCHVCVTHNHIGIEAEFLRDFEDSCAQVRANPKSFNDGSAPIYGLAGTLPDRSIIADILSGYMDILYKV